MSWFFFFFFFFFFWFGVVEGGEGFGFFFFFFFCFLALVMFWVGRGVGCCDRALFSACLGRERERGCRAQKKHTSIDNLPSKVKSARRKEARHG